MRGARFMTACLVVMAVGCTEPAGVSDAPEATFMLRLDESAHAVAAIEIRLNYRRTDGVSRTLLDTRRSIGNGQHELALQIGISEWLADAEHVARVRRARSTSS